jgi:hypothetical protein
VDWGGSCRIRTYGLNMTISTSSFSLKIWQIWVIYTPKKAFEQNGQPLYFVAKRLFFATKNNPNSNHLPHTPCPKLRSCNTTNPQEIKPIIQIPKSRSRVLDFVVWRRESSLTPKKIRSQQNPHPHVGSPQLPMDDFLGTMPRLGNCPQTWSTLQDKQTHHG